MVTFAADAWVGAEKVGGPFPRGFRGVVGGVLTRTSNSSSKAGAHQIGS